MTAANPTLLLTQRPRSFSTCAHPACQEICSRGITGGNDYRGRSSRLSCAYEDPGWHPRCPHRILAGGEQSGRDSESLGRNGATGALAGRVNLYIIWHTGLAKSTAKPRIATDS